MKRISTTLLLIILISISCLQIYAANGNVTYGKNSSGIVFAPGSEQSLTDLFPDFKGVMPGDTLTQIVTLKNSTASGSKIDIYMRAQSTDEESAKLLSELTLRVTVKDDQLTKDIFNAAPSDTTGLENWILLGTLENEGTVDLELSLIIPSELSNEMQNKLGSINWEFRVNDFSIDSDPITVLYNPAYVIWLIIMICAVTMLTLSLYRENKYMKKIANEEITSSISTQEEENKEE